ncbi:MAG: YhcH/YjgK/YiaL family protein [Mucilaginibacter sp.]
MRVVYHYMLFATLILLGINASAQQTNTKMWTSKTARKWVKSRVWSNGLSLKLHPSADNIEFAEQYDKNKAYWDEAFKFLNDKKADSLAPGKYPIDGDNVYAIITEGPSKDFDKSAWESHRNYIDLQYVVKGKEKIGVVPIASATVIKPYDEAKDLANYSGEGKYYLASPDEFFLFFPGDAHRPGIKVEGYEVVKKLVIKIRYTK